MAKAAQRKISVRVDQDQIPTVRPPRESFRLGGTPDDIRENPLPMSLWQLARDVMRAEAEEALWGSGR